MAGYVSSAAEDKPERRTECWLCGEKLCTDCYECRAPDTRCRAPACRCPRLTRALSIPDDRWQEALDDAEDAAVDDAKVREAEGS